MGQTAREVCLGGGGGLLQPAGARGKGLLYIGDVLEAACSKTQNDNLNKAGAQTINDARHTLYGNSLSLFLKHSNLPIFWEIFLTFGSNAMVQKSVGRFPIPEISVK